MSLILTEIKESVLCIKLNRPEKFNSFNRVMALEMQAALDSALTSKSVRCVFITGVGKAFCAGQDLAEAVDPTGPGIKKIVFEHYNPIVRKIRNLEKPVVCAVNGVAAGAGANLALCCDIVIASKGASFIQAFGKIGLIPDSGGTFFLPRIAGFQHASAMMMLGDKIPAEEALAMGMVYRLANEEMLAAEAFQIAARLAQMPTKAIGLTKRLLNASFNNSLDRQLEMEGIAQVEAASSYDYREGVKAFLEKRKPLFRGE